MTFFFVIDVFTIVMGILLVVALLSDANLWKTPSRNVFYLNIAVAEVMYLSIKMVLVLLTLIYGFLDDPVLRYTDAIILTLNQSVVMWTCLSIAVDRWLSICRVGHT